MPKKRQRELDGSLNDYRERVHAEFRRQFDPSNDYDVWVVDIFDEDYVIAHDGDQHYRVEMDVGDDAITFDARRDWQEVRLSYVAEMLERRQYADVIVVGELRGSYPTVELFEDVDYDALIEGDDEPIFLTLPIGKAGVTSGNRRYYDDAFVLEFEKQVRTKKPVGLMGHLRDEDRATDFPEEAVHWVGAARVGEYLWGKGYLPPSPARARIKRYKAQNKLIATSIDAWLEGTWSPELNAYHVKADSLELNQIDLAPADRAGIADLAAVPLLTTEMAPPSSNGHAKRNPESEDDMDKEQIIREMTAEDARLVPQAVREVIAQEAPATAQVRELRTALGLGDKDDLEKVVGELKTARDAANQERIAARIKELVEDEEAGVKVPGMRAVVQELVKARTPATPEDAERAFGEVMEMQSVKDALAEQVVRTMGPRHQRPPAGQEHGNRYVDIPEAEGEDA